MGILTKISVLVAIGGVVSSLWLLYLNEKKKGEIERLEASNVALEYALKKKDVSIKAKDEQIVEMNKNQAEYIRRIEQSKKLLDDAILTDKDTTKVVDDATNRKIIDSLSVPLPSFDDGMQ